MATSGLVTSKRTTLLLLYISILYVVSVSGRYDLEIQPRYFSKENSGCASCGNRTTCDSEPGEEECDNVFIFCTRPLGEAVSINNSFLVDCVNRGHILNAPITSDVIDFDELNTTYRLLLTGDRWSGVQLFVVVLDADGQGPHDVVDVFRGDVSIALGSGYTNETVYNGEFDIAELGLIFRVNCSITFIGENCTDRENIIVSGNIAGATAAGIIVGSIAAVTLLTTAIVVVLVAVQRRRRKYTVTEDESAEIPELTLQPQGSNEPITDESVRVETSRISDYHPVEARLTQSLPVNADTLKKERQAERAAAQRQERAAAADALKNEPQEETATVIKKDLGGGKADEPEEPVKEDLSPSSPKQPPLPVTTNFLSELKNRVVTKSNDYVDIRPLKPTVAQKPIPAQKPTPPEKPIASQKPAEQEKPMPEEKPVEPEKSIPAEKPVEREKPIPAAKPVEREKPILRPQKSTPSEKPVPARKPTPAEKDVSAQNSVPPEKPIPPERSVPVEKPTPPQRSTVPTETPIKPERSVPAEKPTPAERSNVRAEKPVPPVPAQKPTPRPRPNHLEAPNRLSLIITDEEAAEMEREEEEEEEGLAREEAREAEED